MCRVNIGHLRATRLVFSISKCKANTTELHPKVRQTCFNSTSNSRQAVSNCNSHSEYCRVHMFMFTHTLSPYVPASLYKHCVGVDTGPGHTGQSMEARA